MNRRPMPADFAEVAALLGGTVPLSRHYRCGLAMLYSWAAEAGVTFTNRAPIPDDFISWAATMNVRQLAAHYQRTEKTIRKWLAEKDVKAAVVTSGPHPRPAPDDFAKVAPTMTRTALRRHYSASQDMVKRWLDATGITPARHIHIPPIKRGVVDLRPGGGRGMNYAAIRTTSIFDEAADELRRNRWPVHRCDERGVYDDKGEFWRAGTLRLTPDELLARADRYRAKAA